MTLDELDRHARGRIRPDSALVTRHLDVLRDMVRIDSRSFNVNEYEGDRKTPSDMKEILQCARDYLHRIGFPRITRNDPARLPDGATPILLAEIPVSADKPTLLFYAHLDKQPYMDDARFLKWGGVPPTELRWNENRTRAYGRGAADDLSGVVAIGLAVDSLLQSLDLDPRSASPHRLKALPCNIKVIYETEEECGSPSLVEQIHQNAAFFAPTDCVVITDVVNPAQGVPGLTTSLRGISVVEATVTADPGAPGIDEQTALYKLLSRLIDEDHRLTVEAISRADRPVTEEEREGYARVPVTVDALRKTAGVLPGVRLTVPERVDEMLIAQFRRSFVNARPGHRSSGAVVLGRAGARLTFQGVQNAPALKKKLDERVAVLNPFHLRLEWKEAPAPEGQAAWDLKVQAATQDPHSGINGGPFPVPELQLAKMIDGLVNADGTVHPSLAPPLHPAAGQPALRVETLDMRASPIAPFAPSSARAVVEIRLAPGNEETRAAAELQRFLEQHLVPGFRLNVSSRVGAPPWSTKISHPVFSLALESLERGYETGACLYGCGGSIPFVAKLLDALGDVHPLCLGAYDPEARMHEPGESLSLPDLLGCARSMVHFMTRVPRVYPHPKGKKS